MPARNHTRWKQIPGQIKSGEYVDSRIYSDEKIFKKEIITPGVQIGKKNYDQKRSMEAKKVNSDWLVIGRSVTRGNIKKNIQKLIKSL